jgi:hypothetical protein
MPRFGNRPPMQRRVRLGQLPGSLTPAAPIQAGQTYTIVGSAIAFIAASSLITGALNTNFTQVLSLDTNELTGVFSITVLVLTPPGAGTVADLEAYATQQLGGVSGLRFGFLGVSGVYPGSSDYATLAAGVGLATEDVTKTASQIATQAATGVAAGVGAGVGSGLAQTLSSPTGWVSILLLAGAGYIAYKALV